MAAPRTVGIRVRATQLGYYGHTRQRIDDVFTIAGTVNPAVYPEGHKQAGKPHRRAGEFTDFSRRWMERVDPSTPEKTTTPNEAIKREHDDILALKAVGAQPGMQVGPDDVPADLPQGLDNPLGAD
jgi:hypothetical protein